MIGRITQPAATAIVAVAFAGLAALGSPAAVMAHTGHAHADSGRMGEVTGIAATVAALVVVHVLVTWLFRYRDSTHDPGNQDIASPPEHVSGRKR